MWSLGATFAEFFRPLNEQLEDTDEWGEEGGEEAEEDDQQHEVSPFIFSRSASPARVTSWRRLPLFNADRGDIGLAWSIFKIRGTPDERNWPVNEVVPSHVSVNLMIPQDFSSLPHAKLLTFEHADPVDLWTVLPHVPAVSQGGALNDAHQKSSPLDLLDGLLSCSPSARMTSAQALRNSWFEGGDVPLLYPDTLRKEERLWEGHGLGYWFLEVIG